MRAELWGEHLLGDLADAQLGDVRWHLEEIEGWDGVPSPRAEAPEIPTGMGGFMPAQFLFGSRNLVIRGTAQAYSQIGTGRIRSWLTKGSALGAFVLEVEDENGTRQVTGYQGAKPAVRNLSTTIIEFAIYVTCPDPVKYGGLLRAFDSDLVDMSYITNVGDAPVVPLRLRAQGPGTFIFATINEHTVQWRSPGRVPVPDLVINMRSGASYTAGGTVDQTVDLVQDDIVPLPPNSSVPLVLQHDFENAWVEYRPGWL